MARKSRKQIQVAEYLPTEFPMTVGYTRLSGQLPCRESLYGESKENHCSVSRLAQTPDFKILYGH